ncbi:hypothetical protein KIN20_005549 [Parelaphostrongylus tenuis]|uniref:Uncharacterized protein n=1 Tax=Parelaphostrongylus tenuis TaxID=148309 RepID=A0AAD5MLP0_PARTN|nr:hypothetical protein KIN20_005549 [Parelaphostrongylus tenuis]
MDNWEMTCPTMQCPPHPPCNPFPTLAPLPTVAAQGLVQFTLPTLAPFQGIASAQSTALPPLPLPQPAAGQEPLQSFQNNQYNTAQQQQFRPEPQMIPSQPLPPPPPPPPPAPTTFASGQDVLSQVNIEASNHVSEPNLVDLTTKVTTLYSESKMTEQQANVNLTTMTIFDLRTYANIHQKIEEFDDKKNSYSIENKRELP